MEFNKYQLDTGVTAKSYQPKALTLDDLTGVHAVLRAALSTTQYAGKLKKKIFHGHEIFIDRRANKSVAEYCHNMTNVPFTWPVNSPVLSVQVQKYIDNIIGIIDESGEVAEALEKFLSGKMVESDFWKKVGDELGDVLWYIARTADACGVTLEEVAEGNLAKLKKRYPEGFSINNSQNRDERGEEKAQEEAIKNANNTGESCIAALTKAKNAFEELLLDLDGTVAIDCSAGDAERLLDTYKSITEALKEVYHD